MNEGHASLKVTLSLTVPPSEGLNFSFQMEVPCRDGRCFDKDLMCAVLPSRWLVSLKVILKC